MQKSSSSTVNVRIEGDVSGLRNAGREATGVIDELGRKTGAAGEQVKGAGSALGSLREGIRSYAAQALEGVGVSGRLAYSLAGLSGTWIAAAGAAAAYAKAMYDVEVEQRAVQNALAVTSNFAGMTAGSMRLLAEDVAAAGAATIGQSKEIVTQLVASGKVGAAAVGEVARLAENYAAATGKEIETITPELVKLFADPAKGARELNESMHFLNETQVAHIESLQQMGNAQQAQLELAKALAEHLPKHAQQLGTVERAWKGVKEAASGAWDAIMGLGRERSPEEEQKRLVGELNDLAAYLGTTRENLLTKASGTWLEDKARGLDAQLRAVSKVVEANAARADAQARQAREIDRRNQAADIVGKYSGQAKIDELLGQRKLLEETGVAGSAEAIAKIDQEIAKLREVKAERASAATQLLASVRERIALEEAAVGTNGKLTEGERIGLRVRTALANGTLQLTAAQRTSLNAEIERLIALEKSNVGEREAAKAIEERSAAMLQLVGEETKRGAAIVKQNETLADEIAMLGASRGAQDDYRAAKMDLTAATELATAAAIEEQAELWQTQGVLPDVIDGYLGLAAAKRESAKALGEQAALLREKGAKEVAVEQAKESKRAWENTSNDINRALTDSLMRGFESGKGFAENLRDTVVNMFKTTVLRPVISAVLAPVSGAVASVVGAPGGTSAGSAGSAVSLVSGASNLASLYSAVSGGLVSQVGAGVSWLGSALGSSTLSGIGTGISGSTLAAGLAGPTTAGASGAVGLGSTIGAALPYVGAALAVAGLLGAFGGGGGPKSGGDAAYTWDGRKWVKASDPGLYTPGDKNAAVSTALGAWVDDLGGAIAKLGGTLPTGQYALGFDSDPQGTAGNRIKSVVAGTKIRSDVGIKDISQALVAEMNRMFVATAQRANLDDWADDIVDAVNVVKATDAEIAATIETLNGMSQIVAVFDAIGISAEKLSASAVKAMGGFDAVAASVAGYYDTYYSQAEKTARMSEQVADALQTVGLEMPATKAEFRALVEAQDLTTDSGRAAFAALMNVSAAFATVADAAGLAGAAVVETASISSALLDRIRGASVSSADYAIRVARAGGTVPAFASGGEFSGGLRLVGERGPELEVTGPARIYSADQTRRLLSGSADSGIVAELRQLRAENAAQARSLAALQARMTRLLERWDGAGMPEVRSVA